MVVLNVALGVTEIAVLIYSAYYFLSHIERSIFRPKWVYVLAFGVYGAALTAVGPLFKNDYVSIGVGMVLILALELLFFHRSAAYGFCSIIYMICVYLCQTSVIFAVQNLMLGKGIPLVVIANSCLALKIIVVLAVTRLLVYLIRRKGMSKLNRWQAFSLVILPAASLFLLWSLLSMSSLYAKLYGFTMLVCDVVVLLLLNVYFAYLLGYMFKSNRLEQELKIFQTKNEIQYRYYAEMEKKYQDSRKVIHDMKNHLQGVERLYEQEEHTAASAYVKDLYHMLNQLGETYYSDNKMLNIILNDKLQKAKRYGIESRVSLGDVTLANMKDMDITTIFANLLDNSIEAAQGGEGAFIEIKMDHFNDFIVLCVKNSICEEGKKKNGHMGYGLENVRKTLEKYHGTIHAQRKGAEYQVNVTLPKEGGG